MKNQIISSNNIPFSSLKTTSPMHTRLSPLGLSGFVCTWNAVISLPSLLVKKALCPAPKSPSLEQSTGFADGSQIFDTEPFTLAADIMLDFIADMRDKLGYTAEILNLGGGFGVRYLESDPEISITDNIRDISLHVKAKCAERGLDIPTIYMEPGRSLVADAGMTLYTVGSVKEIKGFKNYVSIDGGMTDNPRYTLYQSPYTVVNASDAESDPDLECTVGGRCCESGDLIQENVKIKRPERGDVLAVLVTGAYNHSMSSNYNRVARPPIIVIRENGDEFIAVRRETFADVAARDM